MTLKERAIAIHAEHIRITDKMIRAGHAAIYENNGPTDVKAIYEAMERARTEPEYRDGWYWVKHPTSGEPIVAYFASGCWNFTDGSGASTVTVISGPIAPPDSEPQWIEWNGTGEPPTGKVYGKSRNGLVFGPAPAHEFGWRHDVDGNSAGDIVAYRPA